MARRILFVGSVAVLAAIACCGGFTGGALAQTSGDLYETGADPIAPALGGPTADGDSRAVEETGTTDTGEQSDTTGKTGTTNNGTDDLEDILKLNLKELSQVPVRSASPAMSAEVSTVSRTVSTVGRSPSAVYVITNEMIRRSGARNLPEVLRLVPGVQVAQVTKTTWAISIRGFNSRYANKLLVQIDGRAVYTPGFSGVYWDQQIVLLEDVERIEIIRGPGATVWGANAVNGVINIVTKEAAGTQGLYAESGGGSEHRSFNSVRAGGQAGDLHWRAYGMQADDGPGYNAVVPGGAWDALQYGQGGFRMDWTPSRQDTLTLSGDFLGEDETLRQPLFPVGFTMSPENIRTTNFLGRWTRELSDDSDWSVQLYYDNWRRLATGEYPLLQNQDTFDLDSQYHFKMGDRHDVICGFGYRNYETQFDSVNGVFLFNPAHDAFDIISYFVQDTIELRPERLYLTAGIKCENNDFTGFEYQPGVKLLWAPDERTAIWGSIARAVRTPSVADRDIVLYGGMMRGSRSVRSEDLLAYEMGIRRQPTDKFYWDLAVFFNRYDNLIGLSPLVPPPATTGNTGHGDSYGYELVATYEATPNWRLRTAYSFLVEDITYGPNADSFYVFLNASPRNQCFLQSSWDLSRNVTLDMIWRYVDSLNMVVVREPVNVPHYLVMDVRLAWQPRKDLEVAVVGQNLLDNHHPEFAEVTGITEVQSGVYGMVTWRH